MNVFCNLDALPYPQSINPPPMEPVTLQILKQFSETHFMKKNNPQSKPDPNQRKAARQAVSRLGILPPGLITLAYYHTPIPNVFLAKNIPVFSPEFGRK